MIQKYTSADAYSEYSEDPIWVRYEDIPAWRTVGEHGMPDGPALWSLLAHEEHTMNVENAKVYVRHPDYVQPQDRYIPLSELRRLPGGDG